MTSVFYLLHQSEHVLIYMKNLNQKEHFGNIFHPDIRIACLLNGAIKPPVHLGAAHRPRLPAS